MKIVACTHSHWTNRRNGIIVAGIASRLAVARQSCQSHPPSCSSVPTPTPGQWPQPEEKKISRKKPQEKEPSSWTFTSSPWHPIYKVSYVYLIKQYLLWCLAEGHASKCWRQGFSVHLTARALRPSWSDLLGIISSFQESFFSYLTQKGVLRKAHLKIIVLPSCHIRTLGKRKD